MDARAALARMVDRLQLDTLVFDLAVGLAGVALPTLVLPSDAELLTGWSTTGVLLLATAVTVFVVMQMGRVYRRFAEETDSGFLRGLASVAIFLGTTGLYVGLLLFLVLYDFVPLKDALGSRGGFLVCILLSLAALWGFTLGFPYVAPTRKKAHVSGLLYVPLTMLLVSLPIGAAETGSGLGWGWGLLVFVGGVAAIALPIAGHARFDAWEAPPVLRRGVGIGLAVVGAAMLLEWQRLFVLAMRQASLNNFQVVDRDFVFWWTVAAGIVPFRAITLFAPPISPLNALVAAASFAVYLSALYGAI